MKETRHKYEALEKLVQERKRFEGEPENHCAPYLNHPTDNNFFDIHGFTLIQYAAILGDTENAEALLQSKIDLEFTHPLVLESKTALALALQEGQLPVATLLHTYGARIDNISAAFVHPECKEWFMQVVKESLPDTRANNKMLYLKRLVELNDLDELKKQNKDNIQELFNCAVCNCQLEIIEFLLSEGALINPFPSHFKQSPLQLALTNQQHAVMNYLLDHGANIDHVNSEKQTALMLSIMRSDFEAFTILLSHHANILTQDENGNTVLHFVANCQDARLMQSLLRLPNADKLLSCRNIYGYLPEDITTQQAININQSIIIRIFDFYLRLNYRDTTFFRPEGHCRGLSLLRSLYASSHKKIYFMDTLAMIASWNGNQDDLKKTFSNNLAQSAYYNNLSELMNQWINDIIVLQGEALGRLLRMPNNRLAELNIIGNESKIGGIYHSIYQNGFAELVSPQLGELLALIRKMPDGTQFTLEGGGHSVAGDVEFGSNMIDYYDPNATCQFDLETLNRTLAQYIVDSKYYSLDEMHLNGTFHVDLQIYYFQNKENLHLYDQFELFSHDELPNDAEDAKQYQIASSCGFTHLHAALVTGSIISFETIMKMGCCDITAKDNFNKTVLDYAFEQRNIKMLKLILSYHADQFDIGSLLCDMQIIRFTKRGKNVVRDKVNDDIFDLMMGFTKPQDLTRFWCAEIRRGNIADAMAYIKDNKANVNVVSKDDESLLLAALEFPNQVLIKYLLECGASAFISVNLNNGGARESAVSYVIQYCSHVLPVLLDHIDVNQLDQTGMAPMHYAAKYCVDKAIAMLLERGADPLKLSSAGKSCIEYLIDSPYEHISSLEYFLAASNSPSSETRNILKLIQAFNNSDEGILNKYFDIIEFDSSNKLHRYLLFHMLQSFIVDNSDALTAKALRRIDKTDLSTLTSGMTLLSHAIFNKNIAAAQLLIASGADVNAPNINGDTPLHIAIKRRIDPGFIELLIAHGADITAMNKKSETPIKLAENSTEQIKSLFVNLNPSHQSFFRKT